MDKETESQIEFLKDRIDFLEQILIGIVGKERLESSGVDGGWHPPGSFKGTDGKWHRRGSWNDEKGQWHPQGWWQDEQGECHPRGWFKD